MIKYEKILPDFSRDLRKNMTPEEKHLWYDFLKKLPVTVKRQQCIGRYIVDFYISSKNIVIELDGRQHYSKEGKESDAVRDLFLTNMGIKVLRYQNRQLNDNFDGVCRDIANKCGIDLSNFSRMQEG